MAGAAACTRTRARGAASWRERGGDAIRRGLGEGVTRSSLLVGQITDDDLLRFFTVYETAGMLG